MRVLFVTSLLGREYGGAEISTGLLLDRLADDGHWVRALTTRKARSDPRLVSVSFPVEVPKRVLTVGNGSVDFLLARKVRRQLEIFKPDVAHVQDTYILPAAVAAAKQLHVPVVVTVRNNVLDSAWDMMFGFPFAGMLKRRNKTIIAALHGADRVISVSRYIKGELVTRGVDAEKIVPIYNLPPTVKNADAQATLGGGAVHLFAPGFLAGFKGFRPLILAMKRVCASCADVDLTIVGGGPQRKTLQKLSSELGLSGKVRFVGKVPFADVLPLYAACDVVVFPSIYPEPLGRVTLDAMYFGKPVVASRVGGIPEVVTDQETGILVPPDNPEALANAIITLAENPDLRASMGRKGKEAVHEKFNPEKIVGQHLQVYRDAMMDCGCGSECQI
ncbi:MAG: glycosyltransferase family 4 protein [Candidatus Bathyarchaeia archaeon]|jgi:glycosyltransferase involved in cell wall biosynthesis